MVMDNKEELCWAAGLLEGEGHFGFYHSSGKSYIRIIVNMTDYDVIETLQRIFGCGKIYKNIREADLSNNHKAMHRWQVSNQEDAKRIMETLFPLMHYRKQGEIEECLKIEAARKHRDPAFCYRGHQKIPGRKNCPICASDWHKNKKAEKEDERAYS